MSDLNDLIHVNATIAFNQGVERERERIVKVLEDYLSAFGAPQEELMQRRMADFIKLIKGEQK